ncbi:hypothetical protein PR048_029688 [Dryococelus australis]|uniref:Reverse transcriptase domain-containing protein n=1 Tax=Dryococelus australis TaxID=614101 RepID=A0ABQ9GE33_9NEOP|nr:hypothetical protein PR048_029688 [Dryococelus australis]
MRTTTNYSTVTNPDSVKDIAPALLIDIADSIRMTIERSHLTILVLLDFSKAFNAVNHDFILQKLKLYFHFSDNVIQWMTSYLQGRHQCVSTWQPMNLGIPQSSVLVPLLLSLFINIIDAKKKVIVYTRMISSCIHLLLRN